MHMIQADLMTLINYDVNANMRGCYTELRFQKQIDSFYHVSKCIQFKEVDEVLTMKMSCFVHAT